jgi:hypothetical protein
MEHFVLGRLYGLADGMHGQVLFAVWLLMVIKVGPIISGTMSETVGWRNFWWLNTGILGLSFLMVVFMFPETKYQRHYRDEIAPGNAQSASSNASDEKIQAHHANDAVTSKVEAELEKIEHVPTATSTAPNLTGLTHQETAARDPYLGKGTPAKFQWRMFQPNAHPFKSIFLDLWIPWKMFAFPIVEFASFVVSWSCSSFLTLNLTQSQAFSGPPYHFKPMYIGVSPRHEYL